MSSADTQIGVTMTPDGRLVGWSEKDQQRLEKMRAKVKRLKPGESMILSYKQPRNVNHHRKFFSLVRAVMQNSEIYETEDIALDAIKLAAGHVDWIPHPETGEMIPRPKSISFESMDQSVFDEFYESAIRGVLRWIVPQMTRMDLDQAIEMVARY